MSNSQTITTIESEVLDEIIIKGIEFILQNGVRMNATTGSGLQVHGMTYILKNSLNRLHGLRYPESIRYFCKELLAFFTGSLSVNDGLSNASKYWEELADSDSNICSNYAYHIFYQKINESTQYEWVVNLLKKNPYSRKALVNINQPFHKFDNPKDFPCTIALHFHLQNKRMNCDVFSRSEDLIWGLPYDLAFFSLMNELIYVDVKQHTKLPLTLGDTIVRTTFSQIYDRTASQARDTLKRYMDMDYPHLRMPLIDNAKVFLDDIYNNARKSYTMKWIHEHSNL